jgi:hypothetical protein
MSKKKKKASCCGPVASKNLPPCNQNHKNLSLQEYVDRLRNNPYFNDQQIKIKFINQQN